MEAPYVFEKPLGFHDRTPEAQAKADALIARWLDLFRRFGYRRVSTPTLEYAATIGRASPVASAKMIQLFDAEGRLVVFRPDMTTPIARLAASTLKSEPLPLRLSYAEAIYRLPHVEQDGRAEFTQVGVELIGVPAESGDLEALYLAALALATAGVSQAALVVSDAALLERVFETLHLAAAERERLMTALTRRDYAAFAELARGMPPTLSAALLALLEAQSAETVRRFLDRLDDAAPAADVRRAAEALLRLLDDAQALFPDIAFVPDLTLVAGLEYYTGVFFEGYAVGSGAPIVRGGRYDRLLKRFGRAAPATGFALDLERTLDLVALPTASRPLAVVRFPEHKRREAFQTARDLAADGYEVVMHPALEPMERPLGGAKLVDLTGDAADRPHGERKTGAGMQDSIEGRR